MFTSSLRRRWLSNVRGEPLAATIVALAVIPGAIVFSVIAGVDPKVGLYASFSIAVVIAFTGVPQVAAGLPRLGAPMRFVFVHAKPGAVEQPMH
jgi:MFS superfamily sulfate permease-like transporter